jgi:hypothetical protein
MSKSCSEEIVKQQARRLEVLPNNPGTAVETVIALKRHCKSDYHVKATVQYLLDTQTFYPTPSAIRDAADMMPQQAPAKYRPINPNCSACSGSGYVVKLDERTRRTGAAVCSCRILSDPMPPDRIAEPEVMGTGGSLAQRVFEANAERTEQIKGKVQ